MNGQTEKKQHEFFVKQRRELRIDGVTEVESFDDVCVVLKTVSGDMTIEGKELRVGVLDMERGTVHLTGRIDGVFYSTESGETKKGFWGRMFR